MGCSGAEAWGIQGRNMWLGVAFARGEGCPVEGGASKWPWLQEQGQPWGPPASPVLLLCPPVSEAFPPSAVAALTAPSLEDIQESGAIV